jgi:hypothetical protein
MRRNPAACVRRIKGAVTNGASHLSQRRVLSDPDRHGFFYAGDRHLCRPAAQPRQHRRLDVDADIQTKDHFKNYGGRRTKDKTRKTQVGATGKGTLDEITPLTLSLFALGDIEDNSDGSFTIKGLSKTDFEGFLEIIGDNDEGPQLDWEGDVSFQPSGDFSLIKDNDDYNQINVAFTVLEGSDGEFGEWTWRPQAA